MRPGELERYSSAVSLSDMEIFVFPELMHSLVLANIMSPEIWKWRENDTFQKLKGKTPYRRLLRLRQFIMDEYEFNLDLNTWGLTDKDTELNRFADYISPEQISQSNALFGYHGDEYYFDIGIRRHFGLDKYTDTIIPYWKTETLEAMNAFCYKQGYSTGAGECVSLAALYAAAAFVVCDIPLEDIYMILTPLHSQNYIDIQDGVLTNNRRVITKSMWFNGTAITEKAQRALRNEQVTIVSHNTGYVHCLYDDATIDLKAYDGFKNKLSSYLKTELDMPTFANFLRANRDYQKHFVFCRHHRGEDKFVNAETLFHYEHGSSFRIANDTFDKLLSEVSSEDYLPYKPEARVCVEQLTRFLKKSGINIHTEEGRLLCNKYLAKYIDKSEQFIDELNDFCRVEAQLPENNKKFQNSQNIEITNDMSRVEIIEYLSSIRADNMTADLAFYAYRDLKTCDWIPFLKASLERCPVSIESAKNMSTKDCYDWLCKMENSSIYGDSRLAHPDEVANYYRGDGLEKALTLANIILKRNPSQKVNIVADNEMVVLVADDEYEFISSKQYRKKIEIDSYNYEVTDIV